MTKEMTFKYIQFVEKTTTFYLTFSQQQVKFLSQSKRLKLHLTPCPKLSFSISLRSSSFECKTRNQSNLNQAIIIRWMMNCFHEWMNEINLNNLIEQAMVVSLGVWALSIFQVRHWLTKRRWPAESGFRFWMHMDKLTTKTI